ncbi:MAG: GGDEF domain-containing phosphodiesterase [Oscillospiraceae bacterium]
MPLDVHFLTSSSGLPTVDPVGAITHLESLTAAKEPKGAVIKLYLKNFNLFNDTFGYAYGSLLLEQVYAFLSTLADGCVHRYGGVEFLILLDGASDRQAAQITKRIQARFESTWCIQEMVCICLVSMGLVFYSQEMHNVPDLIKRVEYATSEASRKGDPHVLTIFDYELQQAVRRRQRISQLIGKALQEHQVEIRYRPTFCVEKGIFTRADCYLRMVSPELGIVSAAELIPVAEDSGQICAINRYAIRAVCCQIRRLLKEKIGFESISMPVSPMQLLQEHFVEDMAEILREYRIPQGYFSIELAESAMINSIGRISMIMQELSAIGVEIVLNDFGTGYFGIHNILDFPVDVVKLDRLFVWQLETNPRSGHLIEGLIHIAHNLGLKLIAEGVETGNQVALLMAYGCRYEQGFYYSATVEPDALSTLLGKKPKAL